VKILLVEDNAAVRGSIRQWLIDRIPRVDSVFECSDGNAAVELYATVLPDWVLMDIQLKQMDGLTAARTILGSFPEARIIVLTNHEEQAFREEAAAIGIRWYVLKDDLSRVEEILGAASRPETSKSNQ